MKQNNIFIAISLVLLLFADYLSFHDISEPHSFKDWLILCVTLLVTVYFVNTTINHKKQRI